MRGASIGAVVAGALALWCCSAAGAAPTVEVPAGLVPILGFPHTGNLYAAGAALKLEYRIAGNEYAGHPPPLVGLTLTLPKGTKLHTSGFPTCAQATLEQGGIPACPRGSLAGPQGAGATNLPPGNLLPAGAPSLTVQPFYSPGGGLLMAFANPLGGATRGLATGTWTNLAGAAGAGPELSLQIPLLEPSGARTDPSLQLLSFRIGTAIRRRREPAPEPAANVRTTYYLTLPKMGQCPRGGFQFGSTLAFAGLADIGSGPFVPSTPATGIWPERQLVSVEMTTPCPRREAAPSVEPPPKPAPTPLHGSHGLITALPNSECVGEEGLALHVLARRGLSWRRIALLLDGAPVQVLRGRRRSAKLSLDEPPGGRFTVKVVATTAHGRRIAGTRTYSVCPS